MDNASDGGNYGLALCALMLLCSGRDCVVMIW